MLKTCQMYVSQSGRQDSRTDITTCGHHPTDDIVCVTLLDSWLNKFRLPTLRKPMKIYIIIAPHILPRYSTVRRITDGTKPASNACAGVGGAR